MTKDKLGHISEEFQEEEWHRFNCECLELLRPNNSNGIVLLAFLKRLLKQFRLNGCYTEMYIFNEAYVRAYKLIKQKGEAIKNPLTWLKKTGCNIIYELSRKQQTSVPFEEANQVHLDFNPISDEVLEANWEKVKAAFQQLSIEEQRLINLKIVQGLSWREICNIYHQEGQPYKEEALRKKKERIIKKLRQIYYFS